jgi:hypothetical protein
VTDLEADIDELPEDYSESESEVDETIDIAKKDGEPAPELVDSSSQSGEAAQFTPPTSSTPVSTARDSANLTAAPETATSDSSPEAATADGVASSLSRVNLADSPDATADSSSDVSPNAVIAPIPINTSSANSLAPERSVPECPMTPRNDIGPFVLDGSGSRNGSVSRRNVSGEMGSLEAASSWDSIRKQLAAVQGLLVFWARRAPSPLFGPVPAKDSLSMDVVGIYSPADHGVSGFPVLVHLDYQELEREFARLYTSSVAWPRLPFLLWLFGVFVSRCCPLVNLLSLCSRGQRLLSSSEYTELSTLDMAMAARYGN